MSPNPEQQKKVRDQIERAFAHRALPAIRPDQYECVDSDVEDALWFADRDWRTITGADWREHYCAVTFLRREAFLYYLQSLLILAIEDSQVLADLAVASMISDLDRSPEGGLDGGPQDRFFGLSDEEYDAIKEWLLYASGQCASFGIGISAAGPGDKLGRAFDTIDRLQRMTAGFEKPPISDHGQ